MSCKHCDAMGAEIERLSEQVDQLRTIAAGAAANEGWRRSASRRIKHLELGLEAWEMFSGWWRDITDPAAILRKRHCAAPEREVPCGPGRIS